MRPARTLAVALLLAALATTWVGCAQATDEPATTDPATTQPVSPGNEPQLQGTPAEGPQVEIRDLAFRPEVVEVRVGDTVTWTNADPSPHTVTGSSGLDSPALQQGQSYSHEFTEPGTYWYACSIHPDMRARVVVTEE